VERNQLVYYSLSKVRQSILLSNFIPFEVLAKFFSRHFSAIASSFNLWHYCALF
jgi:hypothetical protein